MAQGLTCPHGVSQEVVVERAVGANGKIEEKLVFTECLQCTAVSGEIVLWERHTVSKDEIKPVPIAI